MESVDLFGNVIEESKPKSKVLGKCQLWKKENNYRYYTDKAMTCRSCENFRRYEYHNKYYHKCVLLGESHSTATDIRISYVCDNYAEKQTS